METENIFSNPRKETRSGRTSRLVRSEAADSARTTLLAKRKAYEETYAKFSQEELEKRVKELESVAEENLREMASRELATHGVGPRVRELRQRALEIALEQQVVSEFLPAEGEVINVEREGRVEAVGDVIDLEKERKKVEAREADLERVRQTAGVSDGKEIEKRRAKVLKERERITAREEKRVDLLIEEARHATLNVFDELLARDGKKRVGKGVREQGARRDMMTHEVRVDIGKERAAAKIKKAEAERPKMPLEVMSARVKTESFWSRMKRSLFGSQTELMKAEKEKEKKLDARLKEEKRKVGQKEWGVSVKTQREKMKPGVISARKVKEPEVGFVQSLWERLTGKAMGRERAARYRSNIEKVGRMPEYALNPVMNRKRARDKAEYTVVGPEDLEEVGPEEELEEKKNVG